MATIANDKLTLVDLAKRLKPDKSLDMIVETMDEDQEILQDMPWVQANQVTGHRTTIRAGLPSGTWRKLNSGVPTEKSRTVQITETIGMLETYLEVDKKLAQLSGNVNEFRAQESRAAIEGMSQTLATTLFYGDTDTEPEKFLGFEARYDDSAAGNAANILDGGGSGSDNSSIWIINWRPDKIHGIYSRGSAVGLQHDDLGEERVYDASNNSYQALVSHLTMDIGLCVRDWRYAVRIANIDDSALTKDAATGADLVDLISAGIERLKDQNGAVRMYCTQNVRSYLRRQIKNSNNVEVAMHEAFGHRVMQVDGVPVRKTHALTATESQVTGL
jgi:hypothetical protein